MVILNKVDYIQKAETIQGAPKAREGKRPVMRIVPMFDSNSNRGALICK